MIGRRGSLGLLSSMLVMAEVLGHDGLMELKENNFEPKNKPSDSEVKEVQFKNGMTEFEFPDGTKVMALNIKNALKKYNKMKGGNK